MEPRSGTGSPSRPSDPPFVVPFSVHAIPSDRPRPGTIGPIEGALTVGDAKRRSSPPAPRWRVVNPGAIACCRAQCEAKGKAMPPSDLSTRGASDPATLAGFAGRCYNWRMQIYLFASISASGVKAFTSDQTGGNLPEDYAPWSPCGGGTAIPIGTPPDVVANAVRRDGFFLVSARGHPITGRAMH
jgi:hypothetical protein